MYLLEILIVHVSMTVYDARNIYKSFHVHIAVKPTTALILYCFFLVILFVSPCYLKMFKT